MSRNADSACELCGGTGFVQVPPNERYPHGAAALCACRERIARRRKLQQLMALSGLDEETLRRWTFDTFDPDAAQADAGGKAHLAQVKALCEAFARSPQGWLVLCGPYGCGKSHLAYAVAGAYLRARRAVYVSTVPDLLDTLRRSFDGKNGGESFERRFDLVRDAELLVLDDLGAQNDTPWAAEKLYQILDHRYRRRLPLLVTTNANLYAPQGRIEPRILSRILDGANLADGFSRVVLLRAGDYRRRGASQGSPDGRLASR
jgi:DNA replication protein DnaC